MNTIYVTESFRNIMFSIFKKNLFSTMKVLLAFKRTIWIKTERATNDMFVIYFYLN